VYYLYYYMIIVCYTHKNSCAHAYNILWETSNPLLHRNRLEGDKQSGILVCSIST
jgi:hypothetical protein